jgi:rhodanese-related sulfurtransferase
MQQISPANLAKMIAQQADFQLIDVREADEHQAFNIGGLLLPLSSITQHLNLINTTKPVIIYCEKGVRSQIAIQRLQQKLNANNFINLQGGMQAWQKTFG